MQFGRIKSMDGNRRLWFRLEIDFRIGLKLTVYVNMKRFLIENIFMLVVWKLYSFRTLFDTVNEKLCGNKAWLCIKDVFTFNELYATEKNL